MNREFERALSEADGVLFLCSGNMVRSAFAELYARHLGGPLPVASAATHFRNGRLLPETEEALAARGVAADSIRAFRPRHLEEVRRVPGARTLALGMARMHLAALERRPELAARAFLLATVQTGEAHEEDLEIADPVLDGADFAQTFERVAACVEALVSRLCARDV